MLSPIINKYYINNIDDILDFLERMPRSSFKKIAFCLFCETKKGKNILLENDSKNFIDAFKIIDEEAERENTLHWVLENFSLNSSDFYNKFIPIFKRFEK